MTILDIASRLSEFDVGATIFAQRIGGDFTPASEAVRIVITEQEAKLPANELAALHCPGLDYCLEIAIANAAVTGWSRWRNDRVPSPLEVAEAICYKATYDAWGPPNWQMRSTYQQ